MDGLCLGHFDYFQEKIAISDKFANHEHESIFGTCEISKKMDADFSFLNVDY